MVKRRIPDAALKMDTVENTTATEKRLPYCGERMQLGFVFCTTLFRGLHTFFLLLDIFTFENNVFVKIKNNFKKENSPGISIFFHLF
jgi:hypothetical protein